MHIYVLYIYMSYSTNIPWFVWIVLRLEKQERSAVQLSERLALLDVMGAQ